MSRCYPFPPPGYVRDVTRDQRLIESIKVAKEEVKKDRKHKKKERKRKERENGVGPSKMHCHKRQRKDEGADGSHESINSEVEFLEKSCLTTELELQTTPQNSCDSTLHSNEGPKQVQSQPLYETNISISLPGKGQKHPEAEVMITNKDQTQREWLDSSQSAPRDSFGHPYSTSANEAPREALRVCQEKRRDPISGASREIPTKFSKEKTKMPLKDVKKTSKKKMPSLSSCTHPEQEKPSSSHQEPLCSSKLLCSKCPPSMATQFLNLIEDLALGRVERKLTDSEDQEWWLLIKFGAKRHQVSNQKPNQGSCSTVWPTARYLPEAGVHALPFTVPF